MNYIALLGWAPGDDGDEVLDRAALVAAFDLDRVTHAAAGYDRQKLDWLNGEWIRRLGVEQLAERMESGARARFGAAFDPAVFREALVLGHERATNLRELLDQMAFLFVDDAEFEIAPESWAKLESTERIAEVLDAVIAHVESCDWEPAALDLRPVIDALGLKPRKVMPALYAAVEGVHRGLPLFESMWLLGRERTVARLRAARARLG